MKKLKVCSCRPGGASDKILTYLKKNSLELEYILLTHGHGDHIGAVNYIKSKTNATIVAHSDEKELLMIIEKPKLFYALWPTRIKC